MAQGTEKAKKMLENFKKNAKAREMFNTAYIKEKAGAKLNELQTQTTQNKEKIAAAAKMQQPGMAQAIGSIQGPVAKTIFFP